MSRYERLIERILRGQSDANIRFADLCALMRHFGFDERTRGSHYLYRRRGVVEKVNLQRGRRKRQALSGETGTPRDPEIPVGRDE